MAEYPYFAILSEAVGASSTATLAFTLSVNEEFTVSEIRQSSTGEFRITNIRDSRGVYYANFDTSDFPFSGFFADLDNQNNGIKTLPFPLVIPGGTTIYFDVGDNSLANNTVKIFLIGKRKTGG